MKKVTVAVIVTILFIVIYSCKKSSDSSNPAGTTAYLDLPATAYTYYQNTNSGLNQIATLGRVLFYDKHLSLNNAIACGSCHKQEYAFADNTTFSSGYENRLTRRNSPAIQNLLGSSVFLLSGNPTFQSRSFLFWDGRETNVQNLVSRPIGNHVEMGISDMTTLASKLSALSYYPALFKDAYGSTEITADKISNSIATFIASITSTNSRADKIFNINDFTLTEQKGFTLFTSKYNCTRCHITSSYYNIDTASFVDIGLDETYTDMGRGEVTGLASDNGRFKIPSLHNVALTAPYMHDGRYKTLEEVLDHYSQGIYNSPNLSSKLRDTLSQMPMRMNISDDDKQALIAYLNTFTDYQLITDPKFSNPFKVK